jgi:hypothetical protein
MYEVMCVFEFLGVHSYVERVLTFRLTSGCIEDEYKAEKKGGHSHCKGTMLHTSYTPIGELYISRFNFCGIC